MDKRPTTREQAAAARPEAEAALKRFNADPRKTDALYSRDHPDHDDVLLERDAIYRRLFD